VVVPVFERITLFLLLGWMLAVVHASLHRRGSTRIRPQPPEASVCGTAALPST
jgi:hypothetical protein